MKKFIADLVRNPKFLVTVFLLVVILGAFWIRFAKQKVDNRPNPSITNLSLAQTKDKTFTKRDTGIYIKVHYPEYQEAMPFLAIANATIRTVIKKEIDNFIANETDVTATDDGVSKLTGEYQILQPVHSVTTIIFKLESESKGSAHPYEYSQVLLIGDTDGQQIYTENLFNKKTLFWKDLSQLSKEQLKTVLAENYDEDMVNEGAGPDPKNFDNVYLSDTGLVVVFNPYQVAPYATGEVSITIPYSAIGKDLLPRFGGK
ncbi:MAG: RsiV family protein [bacterium]